MSICYRAAAPSDGYDTDKMARELCMTFAPSRLALADGQSIVFQFLDKKTLMLQVKEIEGICRCWSVDIIYF